jgi:type I restriction enzyme S subunit
MNEWKEFLIEDLAEFCNAKRVPLSSMQRQQLQGSYPYYGASGIVDYVNDYIFEGSHVLISEDGENLKSRNTPIAFEASGKFWVNNHAHILKAKEPHLTKILIHYFAQLDLTPYLTGAVQPKLNKATLSKIPLYLPSSTAEQKAIASVLSSLDDKIDLLHRQNKTLEAMAETLFRQWFIEEAKEDWVQGKVEDIFVLQRGYDLPSSKRIKGDYPLYAASGLNDNINAYQVEYPTVITGRSGSIGGVYISLEKSWPLNTTLFIKEFKLGTLIFSYFYLKYLDLESFNVIKDAVLEMANKVENGNIELFKASLSVAVEKYKSWNQENISIHTLADLITDTDFGEIGIGRLSSLLSKIDLKTDSVRCMNIPTQGLAIAAIEQKLAA